MFIYGLFTMRSLCRSVGKFIVSKEGKILRSVIEMDAGGCIQVIETLWRAK